jgi:hypothetical protein
MELFLKKVSTFETEGSFRGLLKNRRIKLMVNENGKYEIQMVGHLIPTASHAGIGHIFLSVQEDVNPL